MGKKYCLIKTNVAKFCLNIKFSQFLIDLLLPVTLKMSLQMLYTTIEFQFFSDFDKVLRMKVVLFFFFCFIQTVKPSTFSGCDEKSEYECKSPTHLTSVCIKFAENCSTGNAVWKNFPKKFLEIKIDQNISNSFLLECEVSVFNLTRIQFELRDFQNSTFFQRIFDVGLFRPLNEIVEGFLGNISFLYFNLNNTLRC